jgi:hypothetical protein
MSTGSTQSLPVDTRFSHPGYGAHGLPTPASSTELRAQPAPTDFVSPMTLLHGDPSRHYAPPPGHMQHMLPPMFMQQPGMSIPSHHHQQVHSHQNNAHQAPSIPMHSGPDSSHPSPQHQPARNWGSAPANIVFQTQPPASAADMDTDFISPLTSPVFGAIDSGVGMSGYPSMSGPSGRQAAYPAIPMGRKRTASPGDHEAMTGATNARRKRPSQSVSAYSTPNALVPVQPRRGAVTKSVSSTPRIRGGRRKSNGAASGGLTVREDLPTDSPSPVDLGMPPPAPPTLAESEIDATIAPSVMQHSPADSMTPATPATLMNMSDLSLRTGLSPDGVLGFAPELSVPAPSSAPVTRARAQSTSTAGSSTRGKKGTGGISTYKAILPLPGTIPPSSAPSSSAGPVKKITNHKESEQKRRDSLKAAYDALRGLLPPIPLPTEDGGSALLESGAVLPGALPPRGPPRGPGDGPNRGVSKLQLLRCGNAYIAALKESVERRDVEMERLREEVRRLQIVAKDVDSEAGKFEVDRRLDEEDAPEGVTGTYLVNAAAAADGEDFDDA